ncbi:site-specific tyrosine recombinase XerD [Paenibacillus terreus]|uniref:Tyrosine recombinase XerC n=1 Tax=Paenibacillus terreus TaxID=1387834 RepID=A0ABV5B1X9_9BACL
MKHYITPFIRYLEDEKGLSPSTLEAYRRDVEQFAEFAAGQQVTVPDDVKRTHLVIYTGHLQELNKAPATITRSMIAIRSFFHYLIREGKASQDPSLLLELPKQEKKPPSVLTQEEMDRLLEAPDRSTPAGMRDKAMLELLYAAGLRVSELVTLNVEDVRTDMRFVHCHGAGGKERVVPMSVQAAEWLKLYISESRETLLRSRNSSTQEEALFLNSSGKRLSRQGFWKLLKKYGVEAGIQTDITPHTLRHSFAAHLLENGADFRSVQEMLGHSEISAARMYLGSPKKSMKEVYENFHPRAGSRASLEMINLSQPRSDSRYD